MARMMNPLLMKRVNIDLLKIIENRILNDFKELQIKSITPIEESVEYLFNKLCIQIN